VYRQADVAAPVFRHVPRPTGAELQVLVQQIAERTGRLLERRGIVERDIENAWLAVDGEGGPLDDLIGHSITYRIAVGPRAGQKLERLCRHVGRPPVAVERMALTSSGHVRYTLKTPYRDGTTQIVLEPLDLMARLAALVPPPRMHLTRIQSDPSAQMRGFGWRTMQRAGLQWRPGAGQGGFSRSGSRNCRARPSVSTLGLDT
jgi:hypothetical protein